MSYARLVMGTIVLVIAGFHTDIAAAWNYPLNEIHGYSVIVL